MPVTRLDITERKLTAYDGSALLLAISPPEGMAFDLDALLNSVMVPHQDRFIMTARSDAKTHVAAAGSVEGNEAAANPTATKKPKPTTTP